MLLLIPTAFEQKFIASRIDAIGARYGITVANCGFGPVASAAATMQLLCEHSPARVVLLGIAGGYPSTMPKATALPVGTAAAFSSVLIDGIGCGEGDTFQTAHAMGWPQWTNPTSDETPGDEISLGNFPGSEAGSTLEPPRLLSVCAASASRKQAAARSRTYSCQAEDMEGFSVAMACRMRQVSLTIIRGISNVAGDRDLSRWKIESALHAAVDVLQQELEAGIAKYDQNQTGDKP